MQRRLLRRRIEQPGAALPTQPRQREAQRGVVGSHAHHPLHREPRLALGWQPREPLRHATPGKFFIRHAIDMTGDIRDLAALTATGQLIRQTEVFSAQCSVSPHGTAILKTIN